MTKQYRVYYGGLGSGKSSHVLGEIDISNTFKLGCGNRFLDILNLRVGAVQSHEQKNIKLGLDFKGTTPNRIVADIKNITKSSVLIDDWTTLHRYTLHWPIDKIRNKCQEIFSAIDENDHIKKVFFIVWDVQTYLPFGLYKKRAVWNKELFSKANSITKLEYGIPVIIR